MRSVQRESVNRFTSIGKAALAGLLIAYVFAAAFLSSGRYLHEAVHHDSEHSHHECAISLFERGQSLTSDPVCEMVFLLRESVVLESASAVITFSSVRFLANTTRGPPV